MGEPTDPVVVAMWTRRRRVTDAWTRPGVSGHAGVGRARRWAALRQRGATIWFTGLPAAGKSTTAAAVEELLLDQGRAAYVLDGDDLRRGLCGDLGFSAVERAENVRRAAHVAHVMADAGHVALVALVSPYAADRAAARRIHEQAGLPFVEIYLSTPLDECERRDPKGLYAQARTGGLRAFTGVSDPYEVPPAPDLELPGSQSVGDNVTAVLALVPPVER